jgi:hypothetical protein
VTHRSIWLAALMALLVLGSACGKDSGGDDDGNSSESGSSGGGDTDAATGGGDTDAATGGDEGGSSGGGDEGGSGGDEGGTGGGVVPIDAGAVDSGGIEVCGAETCADPMCCADAFASQCGLKLNARACLPPQPSSTMSDERCPSVSIMGGAFMIASCCTDDMRCGIDANAAGMGCISLEEVRAFSSMGATDGGTGTGIGGIRWPEPMACN